MQVDTARSTYKSKDALPVAIRAYTVSTQSGEAPRQKKSRRKAPLPRTVFVLDVETRTDHTQRLTFGSYRYLRDRRCLEEGLFYAEDLSLEEVHELKAYVRSHQADTVPEGNPRLQLYPLREFLNKVLHKAAFKGQCLVVGFNLPFDLSRLAAGAGRAIHKPYAGGFSLKLWTYLKEGIEDENTYRPRLLIKSLDSKRALTGFAPAWTPDSTDLVDEEDGGLLEERG